MAVASFPMVAGAVPAVKLDISHEPASNARNAPALALWAHIYGDTTGFLAVFSGARVIGRDGKPTKQLEAIKEEFFPYPVSAANAAEYLRQQDAGGREAYFCAHLVTRQRRQKANAAPVSALWADGDGAHVPDNLPRPTACVQSNPGRDHFYWRLTHPIEPARAEQLNHRIAAAMQADPSGWDLTQLLRSPGTHNHKAAETPPEVELASLEDRAYDPDELDQLLPPLPITAAKAAHKTAEAVPGGGQDEPPVRLDHDAMARWRGERAVKGGDRSVTLFCIGCDLARANVTYGTIVNALADRDVKLGFHKYTDRPGEYERIAGKVLAEIETEAEAEPDSPADNEHLPSNVIELQKLVLHWRSRALRAERERDEAKDINRGIRAVLANPNLTSGEKPVAIATVFEYAHRATQTHGCAAGGYGWVKTPAYSVAASAGSSRGATRRATTTLADAGVFAKRLVTTTDEETGQIRAETFLRADTTNVIDLLERLRDVKRDRGAKTWGTDNQRDDKGRFIPACPECGHVGRRKITVCTHCDHVFEDVPGETKAPLAHDATTVSHEAPITVGASWDSSPQSLTVPRWPKVSEAVTRGKVAAVERAS